MASHPLQWDVSVAFVADNFTVIASANTLEQMCTR